MFVIYIMDNIVGYKDGFPVVPAYSVDLNSITFECPFHRKKTLHFHGSNANLKNRLTHRGSHHHNFKKPAPCCLDNGYYLEITDKTIRGTIGKSGKILKRSIQPLLKVLDKQLKDAPGANGCKCESICNKC